MANQTLQSTNFTINFDPVVLPNSPKRANSLFRVVEQEFTTLISWFGVTGGFGPGNRVNINFVGSLPSGGANNFGYKGDGTTTMNLISRESDPNDTNAAAIVRMSFVAEFVEILMSYRNTQGPETWNASDSHGEGLSLICAQLRFPAGYQAAYGTWVNPWLQLPDRDAAAHDWITTPEKSDSNSESFGCSLLFLYYLKSQLGYSISDIIQKGGSTLDITYKNLTGQSGAITALRNLINPYFPVGNTPTLATDNPFPLLRGNQREVNIDPETAPFGRPYTVRSGEVVISPGIFCEKKLYHFDIFSTPQMLTCVATAKGFGQPVYKWRVNGVDVPASGSISPVTSVTMDDPTLPNLSVTNSVPVPIQCAITSDAFTSTLVMTFNFTVKHIAVVIEAFANEKFASTDVTSDIDWITVNNETLIWDEQYNKDRSACEERWHDFVHRHVRYDPFFNILFTLPDPPDDYRRVIRQLEQLSLAVRRLYERSPEDAHMMEQAIQRAVGVDSVVLHVIGQMGRSTPDQEQKSELSE
jgi:hypothetical protein